MHTYVPRDFDAQWIREDQRQRAAIAERESDHAIAKRRGLLCPKCKGDTIHGGPDGPYCSACDWTKDYGPSEEA